MKTNEETAAMTDEELRVAVAKIDGFVWHRYRDGDTSIFKLVPPDKGKLVICNPQSMTDTELAIRFIPDYPNDLNAVHEVEKKILSDEDTGYRYDMALCRVVKAYEVEGLCNHMRLFHATARQRCIALVQAHQEKG